MEIAPLSTFAPNLFAGRTALITGGGRGIGREIALAFAGLGADLIIASRNAENLAVASVRSPTCASPKRWTRSWPPASRNSARSIS
jgi:NAD(P)-dependent dehydrogenase (short-subunit alcohol dehydrogenase family)